MMTRDFIIIGNWSKQPSREAAISVAKEQVYRTCSDMQCFRVDRIDRIDPDTMHVYVSGALKAA